MMERWPSGYTALLTARLPYKYAVPLLVAAFAIALASTVGSAWAQDVAQDQTVESAPRSYQRGISDGLSVTSNFGNPASPNHVPRSYTRSLSETVSVASSFQSPSHSALAESQGPQRAPANYSPAAGQRIDERSGNRVLGNNNKGDSRIYGGTTAYSGAPQVAHEAQGEGGFDFQEMATLGDSGSSDPDDNLLRTLIATSAADYYSGASSYANAVFGAYSLAAIIIVAARSNRVASAGRSVAKLIVVLLPARQPAASGAQADRAIVQIKALLIVVVALLVVISAAGPVVGQAFADSAAGIAYKSGTGNGVNYPRYREWNPATTSWSTEVELPTSGAELYTVKFLYSPSSSLRMIGTLGSDGEIEIYYCDNACTTASKWTGPLLVADMGTPTAGYKYFDIAFEASSGDLLIVYDKPVTETADFYYKTLSSATLILSGENSFNYAGGVALDNEDIRFFKMASKPGSDEIAMVLLDATNQKSYAFIWDGNNFSSGTQFTVSSATGGTSITGESIGVAYETSSGAALVFSGNSANSAAGARYTTSTSWNALTPGDPNPSNGNDVRWVSMKADPAPGSNKVMVCQADDLRDFTCSEFNAGIAGTWNKLEDTLPNANIRSADFAWDPTGSTGLAIWYDGSGGVVDLGTKTWTSSTSTWSGESIISVANQINWVVAATDFDTAATGVDSLWAIYGDTSPNVIGDGEWDAGTPWVLNGETSITANAGTLNTVEVMALDSQRSREVKRYISDDTLPIGDSISINITRSRSVPDSLPIGDSISIHVTRSIADTLTITNNDSINRTYLASRSIIEPAIISDDSISMSVTRAISDSLAVGDAIATTKNVNRSAAETLAVSDSITIHVTRSIADTLTVTDAIARTLAASRSVSDSVTITDSIAMSVTRSVTDALTVSDAVTATYAVSRSITDTVAIADSLARTVATSASISDSLNLSDATASTLAASRSVSDTLSITDSITAVKSFGRSIADSVTITDGTARTLLAARSIADSVTVTDSIAITIAVARSMSDTVAVTDSIAAALAASRSASDTLTVTDSIATTNTLGRSAADTFTVTDSIAATAVYARSASDSLAVTDSVAATLTGINRSASDSLAVTDAVTATYAASRSIADALAITDSISTGGGSTPNVSEALTVTDAITEVAVHWNRDFAEAFTLGDCTPFACNQALIFGESLTIGAGVTPPPSAADTIAITDSITASAPVVTGSGRSSSNYSVELADSLEIADKQEGGVFEIVEEFGQKGMRVSITDALGVTSRMVSFKTLTVGENVEVNIGVQDVEQASVIPPKAEATIQVQAENSGTDQEKFQLIFSYYDQAGRKAHESSQVVELAPGESRLVNVEVPFTSPGTYDIIAEVRSIPEGELLNTTQLTVTVPWLAINLYLLIVAAAMVLGGSGAAITLFVRSRKAQ